MEDLLIERIYQSKGGSGEPRLQLSNEIRCVKQLVSIDIYIQSCRRSVCSSPGEDVPSKRKPAIKPLAGLLAKLSVSFVVFVVWGILPLIVEQLFCHETVAGCQHLLITCGHTYRKRIPTQKPSMLDQWLSRFSCFTHGCCLCFFRYKKKSRIIHSSGQHQKHFAVLESSHLTISHAQTHMLADIAPESACENNRAQVGILNQICFIKCKPSHKHLSLPALARNVRDDAWRCGVMAL